MIHKTESRKIRREGPMLLMSWARCGETSGFEGNEPGQITEEAYGVSKPKKPEPQHCLL